MESNQDSLFHDRVAIVAKDILNQIGLNEEKIKKFSTLVGTINVLPSFGPFAQMQTFTKEIEPLLLLVQDNIDPGDLLKKIPQEKIEYFLNQVITRLEWVKYGNQEGSNE